MEIKETSIAELAILSDKLMAYIRQLENGSQKLKSIALVNPTFFEVKLKSKKFKDKAKEALENLKEIQLEIESRSEKKIGFDFESELINKMMFKIDKAYFDLKGKNKI